MRAIYQLRELPRAPLVTLILLTLPLAAEEVSLPPGKDNTLYETGDGSLSNGVGSHLFVGKSGKGELRRTLIFFDVVAAVPAGATVTDVRLSLNMSRTSSEAAQSVAVHRVLADWGEAGSDAEENEGGGAPAQSGDATWIHTFFDNGTWGNPGGDFGGILSATLAVTAVGRYTWQADELAADVRSWLQEPAANFGWILLGGEEDEASTAKRFDSRNIENPDNQPTLVISYDDVATVEAALGWGELKSRD